MSTCFLKRFVPFMLTLIIGLGLGTFFQSGHTRTQFQTRLYIDHNHSLTTVPTKFTQTYGTESVMPLAILFQPPTRMTGAARRNNTHGVVQLLIEYGADGKARVIDYIKTLPDGLTEEAVRVAELTQFKPQMLNGEPIPVLQIQSYHFGMGQF